MHAAWLRESMNEFWCCMLVPSSHTLRWNASGSHVRIITTLCIQCELKTGLHWIASNHNIPSTQLKMWRGGPAWLTRKRSIPPIVAQPYVPPGHIQYIHTKEVGGEPKLLYRQQTRLDSMNICTIERQPTAATWKLKGLTRKRTQRRGGPGERELTES